MDNYMQGEQPLDVYALGVEEWIHEIPKLFRMGEQYGNTPELKNLEMFHKEVDMKLLVSGIPLANASLT